MPLWHHRGAITRATWHTAVIEWTAGEVRFLLDGQLAGRTTQRVPDASMHWVFMSETSGMATPSPLTSGHVVVDWVAAWAPA